jgi:NADH:ubiquinone reductase (non-electrogenic)
MANPRTRLVILGSGFAGFSLLKHVDDELYDVTVISPRNHFIFTPLLPSTTVGTVEFRSIIEPIRSSRRSIHFFQAHCTSIDIHSSTLQCRQTIDDTLFTVVYDVLVIAVGAISNTYGLPGVEEHAFFLRDLADARAIRQKIIDCFERSSVPGISVAEKQRLLHFLVVGGGPTGVEFAAEMYDFISEDIAGVYPQLRYDVRITLLESADNILNSFDKKLATYTIRHFQRQGINVRTNQTVVKVDETEVFLKDGSAVPYGLLVWATGLGPTSFITSLSFEKDKHSRLIVDEFCKVRGSDNIYALGDAATISHLNLPATGQVAQQQGRYLAKALMRLAKGKPVQPFHYKDFGMLAYIGGEKALANLSSVKSSGYITWLFWRSTYLTKLVSMKNKVLVLFDWLKTKIFGRDISRF